MLAGVLLATVGSAFAATAPAKKASETPKHYSEWLTRSEMQRVPESYMLDFSNRPKWSYVMGIELSQCSTLILNMVEMTSRITVFSIQTL